MIDHLTLHVKNIEASKKFYTAALKPLGYMMTSDHPEWKLAGYGTKNKASLWVYGVGVKQQAHVALVAKSVAASSTLSIAISKVTNPPSGFAADRKSVV